MGKITKEDNAIITRCSAIAETALQCAL